MPFPNFGLRREFAELVGYPLGFASHDHGSYVLNRAAVAAANDNLQIIDSMDTLTQIKKILRDTLNLSHRADRLTADSALLGGIPEFDSMAVVAVVTSIENEFGIAVNDDELSADVFATVGSLTHFVSTKLVE